MNLIDLSIRRPVFAWMLMFGLIFFGGLSFRDLGVSLQPDVDMPYVNISASLEGASPEVMESDVVDPIESAMLGVENLKKITSSASYGSARIGLEFQLEQNIDVALQEVQARLSQLTRRLPKEMEPPTVSKQNPEDQPIMWIGFAADMPVTELMSFAKNQIIPQFQMVPGVAEVFLGGYLDPNIRIWLDLERMRRLELTVEDILNSISSEHVEYPAGRLEQADKEYNLRVIGEATSLEEVRQLPILRRGGGVNFTPVTIGDVARVELGTEDVRRRSRTMGVPSVGMGIRKQRGVNAVEVASAVKTRLAEVEASLPENAQIAVNFDSTTFIEESVNELLFELVLAALLTGLVCFLFLGSLSSTVNILLAIPTSLVGSFIAFKYFGFTLNFFTLLALILAVGIVVDDAIMVLENIVRHRAMGKSRLQAARDGAKQISFAAMATTLAIVAIFIPIAFMKGIIGKFFFQFAVAMSVAVGLSLLEALTLTPMRCSQYLAQPKESGLMHRLMQFLTALYKKALDFSLAHRVLVIATSFAIFASSLLLLFILKKEFTPAQDQGLFLLRLRAPIGTSLEKMDTLTKQAEEYVSKIPEIKRYFVSIGGFGSGQVNTATMFVTLKPHSERKKTQQEIMAEFRKGLAQLQGVRAVIQDLSVGGFGSNRGYPVEFSIRGPEWSKLVLISKEIIAKLEADERFVDVDSNFDEGVPEIKIFPKRVDAAHRGVDIATIGQSVSALAGGARVARYNQGGSRIDIRVRLEEFDRKTPEDLLTLPVRNNRGQLIRLSEVAEVKEGTSLVSITREQRERAINIFSNVAPGASQASLIQRVEEIGRDLPFGYRLVLSGSSEGFREGFANLQLALWLGIIIAYMILASQFNSFFHPLTVLLALPFSVTGAFLALYLGGASLNVYSFIGLILLMGIVKKNSIMLVDFANQVRLETPDKSANEAIKESAPLRLRPILMTSLTVISASIPSVLGLGPGSETRVPMSLAVIGGVFVSTLFTLIVVPAFYSLMDDLIVRLRKRFN